ncbi:hypothetical protein IT571_09790 [Candidatus Sumerlaeota bacterium]|nr:hypothetical protein [Candidatus Sumerlaeota bacterium]
MQKLLTVRIDGALLQRLRVATVQRDTTIAQVVRQGLEEWLAKGGTRAAASAKSAKGAASKSARKAPAKRARR